MQATFFHLINGKNLLEYVHVPSEWCVNGPLAEDDRILTCRKDCVVDEALCKSCIGAVSAYSPLLIVWEWGGVLIIPITFATLIEE